ncbi:hypothetical protein VTO42DRAFT_6439 [Malbranchea cinnamomea]
MSPAQPLLASSPPASRTPRKGEEFIKFIYHLNITYALDLPLDPPRQTSVPINCTLEQDCVKRIRFLYFQGPEGGLSRLLCEFDHEVTQLKKEKWVFKPRQEEGTLPRRSWNEDNFLKKNSSLAARDEQERALFVRKLHELVSSEADFLKEKNGIVNACSTIAPSGSAPLLSDPNSTSRVVTQTTSEQHPEQQQQQSPQSPSKRRLHQQQPSPRKEKQQKIDQYYSPTRLGNQRDSPIKNDIGNGNVSRLPPPKQPNFALCSDKHQTTVNGYMKVSKVANNESQSNLTGTKPYTGRSAAPEGVSFSTTAASDITRFSFAEGCSTVATTFRSEMHEKALDDVFEENSRTPSIGLFTKLETESGLPGLNSRVELQEGPTLDQTEARVRELVQKLEENGPFSKKRACCSNLPFRYRYEAQRMADACGVPLADVLPRDTLPPGCETYDGYWKYLKDRCKNTQRESVVEKTKAGPWEMAVDLFQDTKTNTDDVVTLSGKLEWCEKSEPMFRLNPLRFERGYRFCRRFGSDRFLEITFPALQKAPQFYVNQGYEPEVVLRGVARWLATSNHYIAGRTWRGFFLEEVKKKKKSDVKESKVYLFAVDGDDFVRRLSGPNDVSPPGESADKHTPMCVDSLINWHIPFEENSDQKDCKLFQRLALGLSRTLPTVILRPEEIIGEKITPRYVTEKQEEAVPKEQNGFEPRKEKEIMNDGCALMSRSLAVAITEHLGLPNTPSCFQGRIAGAKGVWMVVNDNEFECKDRDLSGDFYWIEVTRDSQLKIRPHPSERKLCLDKEQLTFEVVSWSLPLHPANLNMQLLMILQHGGVRRDHLEDLLEREMSQFYEEFKKVFLNGSGLGCRWWLQAQGYHYETKMRKSRRIDGFPTTHMEQAILLLESGFLPLQLPYLKSLFDTFLNDQLNMLNELKIPISQSTYAYCIADPYGILEPDEVHFAFSKSWEEYGYYGAELDEVYVLVGRLPAHRPWDVQRRKAVYRKQLRHFRDVIVFPTTGDTPLASILSGGDYDGDQPWICWDPDIVNAFQNTPFNKDEITPADRLGLVNHSASMEVYERPGGFDDFLAKMFSVNAVPSQLGLCTVHHEKLCYAKNSIDSPQALKLADLLANLVDAPKAGYELTPQRWRQLRAELGLNGLPEPAYKVTRDSSIDEGDSFIEKRSPNLDNIIDYLRFKVVQNKCESIRKDFARLCEEKCSRALDKDLIAVWMRVWEEAIEEDRLGRPALKNVLLEIRDAVDNARRSWLQDIRAGSWSNLPYLEMIDRAAELLEEVKPPSLESLRNTDPVADHAFHGWVYTWHRWEESWVALRASCVYRYHGENGNKFPWYAAGTVLCQLKACAVSESSGTPLRFIVWDVYRGYKVHGKTVRKLEEETLRGTEDEEEIETEEEDVFVDAQEKFRGDEDGGDTEPDTDYDDDDWVPYASPPLTD